MDANFLHQLSTPVVVLAADTWLVVHYNQSAERVLGTCLKHEVSFDDLFPEVRLPRLKKRLEQGRRTVFEIVSTETERPVPYEFRMTNAELFILLEGSESTAKIESEAMLASYTKLIEEKNRQLAKEARRAEQILLNVLPQKTISQLREFGRTIPERFENVSVLFLDFVGFTQKARQMSTDEVFRALNQIFSAFDEIVDHFECERIKTIGDAYLAVCGMPNADPDHAPKIASVALEMVRYLESCNATQASQWTCRIGIHSAPVIGGVVGRKKYIYDIFGDGVNLASRMENLSAPMCINISQDTRDLLGEMFEVESRGNVDVKGIGSTPMYYLRNYTDPARRASKPLRSWETMGHDALGVVARD